MDFWDEEFKIYKTFGEGRYVGNKYKPEYNQRQKWKQKGCWCNGPHYKDPTKKSKFRIINLLYNKYNYWMDMERVQYHFKELKKTALHNYRKRSAHVG